jgi:predicted phosphodiesterase
MTQINPTRIKSIAVEPDTKIIVMSDMHRGDGTGSDDFAHNSLIYKCALDYYLREGFIYIELGDAEELWENKSFDQIYITHTSVYDKIREFHDLDPKKTRYIKIWGNHDIQWRDNADILREIFPGIRIYEAAILHSLSKSGKRILLWHGHQADPKCSGSGAAFSKFFVRNFWPCLQRCGIKDPTRAAVNPGLCNQIDEKLYRLAINKYKNTDIIIAGHTHRPVYENLSITERRSIETGMTAVSVRKKLKPEPVYYNTGSCVHPRCITGIEITARDDRLYLTLIKWSHDVKKSKQAEAPDEYNLSIKRTVLEP